MTEPTEEAKRLLAEAAEDRRQHQERQAEAREAAGWARIHGNAAGANLG